MEANKNESEKCVQMAHTAITVSTGEYEKANKFLLKAQKLYPSELVNSKPDKIINIPITFYTFYLCK